MFKIMERMKCTARLLFGCSSGVNSPLRSRRGRVALFYEPQ